jgi:hypothetical protein
VEYDKYGGEDVYAGRNNKFKEDGTIKLRLMA